MLKKKAYCVWKGHLNSHPCLSSERENIWGYQLWNVSILSRVYSSCFLIWKGKTSVNAIWKSICQLYCTFPCSIKPLRGDVQSGEELSQYITHHHPQQFMGVLEKTECTRKNKFRNKKEELQNFNKKRKRTEVNDRATLSHEISIAWMNACITRFFTKPKTLWWNIKRAYIFCCPNQSGGVGVGREMS